ncbi:MAG: sugar phosphate isomerase/epimerase family protein [Gemmataceae bacterium]
MTGVVPCSPSAAFADEIGPDPQLQVDVLKKCGVRHIEFRSIHGTNVLALSDAQVREFKALLDANGFKLSAIGSPIGKVRIDEPFAPHLEKFERAIELCKLFGTPNIRVFSYYPPEGKEWDQAAGQYRAEVMERMLRKCERAKKAGVRLVHENEHRIYGDSPARVVDLLATVLAKYDTSVFGAVYDAANYVFCGYDPWEGWEKTRDRTVHFHIKDWKAGEKHGSIPGEGQDRSHASSPTPSSAATTASRRWNRIFWAAGRRAGRRGRSCFPGQWRRFGGLSRRRAGRRIDCRKSEPEA